MATRTLIVGFGSIGQRHARVLAGLGCDVAVVTRRTMDIFPRFGGLADAVAVWRPDYIVIASRTSEHFADMTALTSMKFSGRVLLEKPLFERQRVLGHHRFSHVAVAYNLRTHPLLLRLKEFLEGQNIVCAQAYVGQYLPQWRPNTDYRTSYSAVKAEGGGALRDLSHEIDYALWLFGRWKRLTALGGHYSSLEIETDDAFTLIFTTDRCPMVQLHMNYFDRSPRREILVHTERHSVRVDFIRQTFEIDGIPTVEHPIESDATYKFEHVAMLSDDTSGLCSLEEAAEVLAMIEAAESAAVSGKWLNR